MRGLTFIDLQTKEMRAKKNGTNVNVPVQVGYVAKSRKSHVFRNRLRAVERLHVAACENHFLLTQYRFSNQSFSCSISVIIFSLRAAFL
jgi:hypothetical protein